MESSIQRIKEWPLRADQHSVRGAATGYHVTTISDGMNDREEYARLFAASPNLLVSLQSLVDAVLELRRRGIIDEKRDVEKIDALLIDAQAHIGTANGAAD